MKLNIIQQVAVDNTKTDVQKTSAQRNVFVKSTELWLTGKIKKELSKIVVTLDVGGKEEVHVSAHGESDNCGLHSFQWSPAVHALTSLLVKAAGLSADKRFSSASGALLIGEAATSASSLDYAISMQPRWLLEMFGRDENGISYLRQFIRRENAERKESGPVKLSLDTAHFPASALSIFVNGSLIKRSRDLRRLAMLLESTWEPPSSLIRQMVDESSLRGETELPSSEVDNNTCPSVLETLCQQYVQIWKNSVAENKAIQQTSLLVGHSSLNSLLYLDCSVEVNIENERGDTEVLFSFDSVNITNAPVKQHELKLYFEVPRTSANFSMRIHPVNHHPAPSIDMIRDYANYKQYALRFQKPLKPLERIKYSYSFKALEMYPQREDNYWDFPITHLMRNVRLSISHRKKKKFKVCYVTKEINGGSSLDANPDVELEKDENRVFLQWRKSFPALGETYRTYWNFAQ